VAAYRYGYQINAGRHTMTLKSTAGRFKRHEKGESEKRLKREDRWRKTEVGKRCSKNKSRKQKDENSKKTFFTFNCHNELSPTDF
jgi:hypothetical protein